MERQCTDCGKYYTKEEDTLEEITECDICNDDVCFFCYERCEICGKVVCKGCFNYSLDCCNECGEKLELRRLKKTFGRNIK